MKVYYYEVSYESIFIGLVSRSFPTREERDEYYRRRIKPYAWGSDPALLNVRFNDGSFLVNQEEADLWIDEGYHAYY